MSPVAGKSAVLLIAGAMAFGVGRYRATRSATGQDIAALNCKLEQRTPANGAAVTWRELCGGGMDLTGIPSEDLESILTHAVRFGIDSRSGRQLANDLLLEWSQRDPVAAAKWIFDRPESLGLDFELIKQVVAEAAQKDYRSVYDMLRSSKNSLLASYATPLLFKAVPVEDIAGLIQGLPPSKAFGAVLFTDSLSRLSERDFDAASRLLAAYGADAEMSASVRVSMLKGLMRQAPERAWDLLARQSCSVSAQQVELFRGLLPADLPPGKAQEILARIAKLPGGFNLEAGMKAAAEYCSSQGPGLAAKMAEELPAASREKFLALILQASAAKPGFDLTAGLSQLSGRSDQMELLRVAADQMRDQPQGALWKLSESIPDPQVREAAIRSSIDLDAWRTPEKTLDQVLAAGTSFQEERLNAWLNSLVQHSGGAGWSGAAERISAWAATASPENVASVKAAVRSRIGPADLAKFAKEGGGEALRALLNDGGK